MTASQPEFDRGRKISARNVLIPRSVPFFACNVRLYHDNPYVNLSFKLLKGSIQIVPIIRDLACPHFEIGRYWAWPN